MFAQKEVYDLALHWKFGRNHCKLKWLLAAEIHLHFYNLPKWCDTWWSSVGDFCPSNFMAKFWKDTFVPVSQKIKFAHYWISNGGKMRHLGSDFFLQKGLISKFPMFSLLGFPKWNPKKILFWPESSLSDELFAPVFTKWLLENGIGLNQGHINWIKIYNNNKLKRTLIAF